MNKNKLDDVFYSTSNFYCSVFLYVKGLQLVDIDRSNPQRAQFVFVDTPERERLLRNYNFAENNSPEVVVDARAFEAAIKVLKDRLYQTDQKGGLI